jgi:hypothetical protein
MAIAKGAAMSELSEKQRDNLDEDQFAFPNERKEPLNNASHVRNAIARFKRAAKKFDVELTEDSWHDLRSKK